MFRWHRPRRAGQCNCFNCGQKGKRQGCQRFSGDPKNVAVVDNLDLLLKMPRVSNQRVATASLRGVEERGYKDEMKPRVCVVCDSPQSPLGEGGGRKEVIALVLWFSFAGESFSSTPTTRWLFAGSGRG